MSAAQYAERAVIENSPAVHGVKECWRLRLASLRNELGYVGAPILEQLLIQDAALSWLKLSIVELQYSNGDETVDHTHARNLLGEKAERCTATFHARL